MLERVDAHSKPAEAAHRAVRAVPARRRQEEHGRPGTIPIEMQILADARNLG
jgi:hypothetical protein